MVFFSMFIKHIFEHIFLEFTFPFRPDLMQQHGHHVVNEIVLEDGKYTTNFVEKTRFNLHFRY